MTDQIEETIRKFALQNAVFFKGTANPKALGGGGEGDLTGSDGGQLVGEP